MHKFTIDKHRQFSELPLNYYNGLKFSVYIIDFNWNYLFINDFVKANLGNRGESLIGKNMWAQFPELARDLAFNVLKTNMDKGIPTNLSTISPINGQRLNITGCALEDCFYFTSSIIPDKSDLLNEIRKELKRGRA